MKRVEVVAGVIFNTQRTEVLLALRKPEQHQGDCWEFPGGKLESGESLEAGLARELLEEVGIEVEASEHRQTIDHRYPDKHVTLHFRDVTHFSGKPVGREGQDLKWVALQRLSDFQFPEANQAIVDDLVRD